MLKVFGCLSYASTYVTYRNKFDPRSGHRVFLHFQLGIKGYIILDLDNKESFVSKNVLFHEMHFPFLAQFKTKKLLLSHP